MFIISPTKEILEAAQGISVDMGDLEFIRTGLWTLPSQQREKPEVRKLLDVYKHHSVCQAVPFEDVSSAD